MSGLGGLAIVLVIVIWLFVLAPVLLRDQERIRQTDTGFEKTRVLYQGNSGSVPSARRATIAAHTKAAAHAQDSSEVEDSGLVDDDDVVVVSTPSLADTEVVESPSQSDDVDIVNGEVIEDITESLEDGVASSGLEAVTVNSALEDISICGVSSVVHPFDEADGDAYLEPEDLLYHDPAHASAEVHIEDLELSSEEEDLSSGVDQLTAEEMAFAKTRSQRGSWDPEMDHEKSLTTYQRRQRTLLTLMVSLVVAVAAGFMLGSWAWVATVVVLAVSAVYLVALRQQVRAEEDLRQRRIHQLRRRMNGVLNAHDEELSIDRQYYYPGAEVVQRDEENCDFVDLPLYRLARSERGDDELCGAGERYAS